MATALELVNRLKRESGRSGSVIGSIETALSTEDARLLDWLSDANRDLEREPDWDWPWMVLAASGPTVADQQAYAASDLDATITDFERWARVGNDWPSGYQVQLVSPTAGLVPLQRVGWDWFEREFVLNTQTSGQPIMWCVNPSTRKMHLGPTPDAVYTLHARYVRSPVGFSADDDTPGMPAKHHNLLVWKALVECGTYDAAIEVRDRGQINYDRMHRELWLAEGPSYV